MSHQVFKMAPFGFLFNDHFSLKMVPLGVFFVLLQRCLLTNLSWKTSHISLTLRKNIYEDKRDIGATLLESSKVIASHTLEEQEPTTSHTSQ